MSKYIFSLYILLASFSTLQAQETKKDTVTLIPKTDRYGLRLGVDVSKLARTLYEKDYKGFEVVGDYRLNRSFYIAGEIGNENKTRDEPNLNFTTKGTYFKVGFDYNAYENWLNMENIIFIGLRYGVSSFSQTLNRYSIYYNTSYTNPGALPSSNFLDITQVYPNQEFSGLSAHWVEVVGGVKTEIFDNLYIGFSVRLNRLVSNKKPGDFDNLYIPGFNRTYDGDFGIGYNYSISYFIPIFKKKVLPKAVKEEKKEDKKKVEASKKKK
ncbi:DUF6048 family protein [Flavobacterium sp. '19STA2R22 D10 B1']|uniref:DUF6048 family protein n=1 Tax=Flavobacterium aerium TaxID=3037261 RepID=UPI00278C7733|nr:DUF6048 family protein [Flavobacterium sp. '19STA2R22 D10 B1']